jgi:hypothetical protein
MTRLAYPRVIAWFEIAVTLAVLIGVLYGPLFDRWWPFGHAAPGEEFAEASWTERCESFAVPEQSKACSDFRGIDF